jgi:Cytochrome c/c1 heme lyase
MLDSTNNMPREPNQRPWAGQQAPLSTQRVVSSIPKGGTADSWLYPSPQMFFNGEQAAAILLRCRHLCTPAGSQGGAVPCNLPSHSMRTKSLLLFGQHTCPACAALMRKGKGEDVTEQDMASVVHAHNCEPAHIHGLHQRVHC